MLFSCRKHKLYQGEIMRNIINYYYNFNIENIHYADGIYYFTYLNKNYMFLLTPRSLEELPAIYELDQWMVQRSGYYHRIILNKEKKVATLVDQRAYVLLELSNVTYDQISLYDIRPLPYYNDSENLKILRRNHWTDLWEQKVDYLEYQIEHLSKKYRPLIEDAYYFIGMAENAIVYVKSAMMEEKKEWRDSTYVCHRRVASSENLNQFYNPLSLVIDYRVRDIAEFLKSSFMNDDYDLEMIERYLSKQWLNNLEKRLLFGRMIFPTFFFDFYERTVNENLEIKAYPFMDRMEEYRIFLNDLYVILKKSGGTLPEVKWITKKNVP